MMERSNSNRSLPNPHPLASSRITNLPYHHKRDLSSQLNFVVVFQAIEIERLSDQLEGARVLARDYQRQLTNHLNYEVQIRELTQQCHHLDSTNNSLAQQLQYTKAASHQMFRELETLKKRVTTEAGLEERWRSEVARRERAEGEMEKWKRRVAGQQAAHSRELEEMRAEMENRRKSTIDREMKELTVKYENELAWLGVELRKERELSDSRGSECARMKEEVSRLQVQREEGKALHKQILDYQNQMALLSQQNFRLNELVRWKTQQAQERAEREVRLKEELKQSIWQEANKQQLQQKQVEIQRLDMLLQKQMSLTEELKTQVTQRVQQQRLMDDYQRQVEKLNAQLQRINRQVEEKNRAIDQLRSSVKKMEKQLIVQQERERQVQVQGQGIAAKQGQELRMLVVERDDLKSQCEEIKGRNDQLTLENKRTHESLSSEIRKTSQLSIRVSELQHIQGRVQELQIALIKQQDVRKQLISQNDYLGTQLKSTAMKAETWQRKVATLESEADKYALVMKELQECRARIGYMNGQVDRLAAEIQGKSELLTQVRQQVYEAQQIKHDQRQLEEQMTVHVSQMEQFHAELVATLEKDQLQATNEQFVLEIQKLQSDATLISLEKNQLTEALESKKGELAGAYRNIQQLRKKASMASQLQTKLQHSRSKEQQLKSNYETQMQQLKKERQKADQYSMEVERMTEQISEIKRRGSLSPEMKKEIGALIEAAKMKDAVILSLMQRTSRIEVLLMSVRQKSTKDQGELKQMVSMSQAMLEKVTHWERLISLSQSCQKQLHELQEQVFNTTSATPYRVSLQESEAIELPRSQQPAALMSQIREDVEGEEQERSFMHLPSPRDNNLVGSFIHQLKQHSPHHKNQLHFARQSSPSHGAIPNKPFWKGEWKASAKQGVLSPTNRIQVTSPTPIKRLNSLTKPSNTSPVVPQSPQPVIRVLWASGSRNN